MRDVVTAEKEELLARPLVFWLVAAPAVTRFRSTAASWATGAPKCDPPRRTSAPVGGETKQNTKLQRLERIAKIQKSSKSHKRATAIHGDDAPNVFEINWAKGWPNFDGYKKIWQDASKGNFHDGGRLVDKKTCP